MIFILWVWQVLKKIRLKTLFVYTSFISNHPSIADIKFFKKRLTRDLYLAYIDLFFKHFSKNLHFFLNLISYTCAFGTVSLVPKKKSFTRRNRYWPAYSIEP